jgi:hypothetical protein
MLKVENVFAVVIAKVARMCLFAEGWQTPAPRIPRPCHCGQTARSVLLVVIPMLSQSQDKPDIRSSYNLLKTIKQTRISGRLQVPQVKRVGERGPHRRRELLGGQSSDLSALE